jgi:branched-chain amino acid transport system ATP-binding protein
MNREALLSVEGLETAYGDSQVLFGIDLALARGEVVALLGRNGMGKTTTVRSIIGLTPPRAGAITFRGERIERRATDRIARAGIALVPEGRQIFANLTVRENLVAFADNRCDARAPWTLERVFTLFPRLQQRAENMGNQLSGGEQQMLAIGRALMTNPHLLVLDEATEGLAPLIREESGAASRASRRPARRSWSSTVCRTPGAHRRPAHHHRARPRGLAGRFHRVERRSRAVAPVSGRLSGRMIHTSILAGRNGCRPT